MWQYLLTHFLYQWYNWDYIYCICNEIIDKYKKNKNKLRNIKTINKGTKIFAFFLASVTYFTVGTKFCEGKSSGSSF